MKLAEIAWTLRAPAERSVVERALGGDIHRQHPTLGATITEANGRLTLEGTVVTRPEGRSAKVRVEIEGLRMCVRRSAVENDAGWLEACDIARQIARDLGASFEREPQPALYALSSPDEPITPATQRFEPDGLAAALFAESDIAPYPTIEPLGSVLARAEKAANLPGNYEGSFGRLIDWLVLADVEGASEIAYVREPDPFTGLRCSDTG